MNKKLIIFTSTAATFGLMWLYEFLKELFFRESLTIWQSHWITITFTSLIVLMISSIVINKIQEFNQRRLVVELKEAKIKSIKQAMSVAEEHFNSFATNLALVRFEIEADGQFIAELLDTLQETIEEASVQMKHLAEIEEPYDESVLKG